MMVEVTKAADSRTTSVEQLRAELKHLRSGRCRDVRTNSVVSTGVPALDKLLPESGLRRGMLSEWISTEAGSGALTLAMFAAGQAQDVGPLVVVDRLRCLYSPTIQAVGVRLAETMLVCPDSRNDELWAVEQTLRCPGIGAVLFRVDSLRTQEFRRLQLAAESSTAVGLLIRPAIARQQPGWADVRIMVTPQPSLAQSFCRRLEVRCLHAKGTLTNKTISLDICDETGAVRLAAELPDSAGSSTQSPVEVDCDRTLPEVRQSSPHRYCVD